MFRDEGAGLRELTIEVIELWERSVSDDHHDHADRVLFDAAATELSDMLGLEGAMRIRLYSDGSLDDDIMWSLIAAGVHATRVVDRNEGDQRECSPWTSEVCAKLILSVIHRPRLAAVLCGDLGPRLRTSEEVHLLLVRAGIEATPMIADDSSPRCLAERVLAACWDEPGALRRIITRLVSPEEYDTPDDVREVAELLNCQLVPYGYALVSFCGRYELFGISLTVGSPPGDASWPDSSSVADRHEGNGAGNPE